MKRCPLSSAEAVAGNEDLLAEILVRIPTKPLVRFKCVSKPWLSLISSAHFCRSHTLRHPTSSVSGIVLRRTPSHFELISLTGAPSLSPIKPLNFLNDIKILQSCNGLLLCSTIHKKEILIPPNYYVYNPTTNKFSLLPHPTATAAENSVSILGINLAFDPTRSPNYTVICIQTTAESSYYYQILLYSSEIRAWKSCGFFIAPRDMNFHGGVYWNGAIHWMSSRQECLRFVVSEKCLRKFPRTPANMGVSASCCLVTASCGNLHYVEASGPCNVRLRVFRLERDYSRWIVMLKIDLAHIAAVFPEMLQECHHRRRPLRRAFCHAYTVLSVVQDHGGADTSLLIHIPGKIIAYSFKYRVFYKHFDLMPQPTTGSLQVGCFDAYDYVETLACV